MARREYSALELRARLEKRGYDATMIDDLLDELRRAGWQDDGRYAASVLRSRLRRGYGPLDIRHRLHQAGIAADQAATDVDWNAVLAETYTKKYGDTYPDSREEYARRGRFLQGRGFSGEQIRNFLDRLKRRRKEAS